MSATVIDTPEGIAYFRYVSIVQGLGLELKTGMRYTHESALKVAQRDGITSVTGPATKKNLVTCLAELIYGQPSSPVIDHANQILAEVLEANGWEITLTEAPKED